MEAGGVEPLRPIETRKLLKIRGAQLAEEAQDAARMYMACTRNSSRSECCVADLQATTSIEHHT